MELKERAAKLEELMKDESNVKALLSNKTPEEAQAWLKERGLEFSIEELNAMCATIKAVVEGRASVEEIQNALDRELTDEELKSAAGGVLTEAEAALVYAGAAAGLSTAAATALVITGGLVIIGAVLYFGWDYLGIDDDWWPSW